MCGIIGIIDTSYRAVKESELLAARDLASHRGPDGAGHYCTQNLGLGHRRLSIVGLSDKGTQPMTYLHVVVIHNGEIYNYLEIKRLLLKEGYSFQSETDTEVLAAAYCHWGDTCVEKFNGIWAFAIFDTLKQIVFCSRDRFGVKPFYHTFIGTKFCFASEIKQFSAIEAWSASPNESRCVDWLQTGIQDHTLETFFNGVTQLPAGHNLFFDLKKNRYSLASYYRLEEKIEPLALNFADACKAFRNLLEDAIELQMRSDVKLGLTLSGGLDSSVLAGFMSKSVEELACFSACFHEKGYNEQPYLDAVIERNKLSAHKIFPDGDTLFDCMAAATYCMDEPLPSPSEMAHFLVFKKVKTAGIKVNICGQGADEILGGYDAFYPVLWRGLWPNRPIHLLMEIGGFIAHHPQTILNRLKKQRGLQKPLPDSRGIKVKSGLSAMQRISVHYIETSVLPFILHSEDRLSMAHGIESRVPFLDHHLVEFSLSAPDEMKIKSGVRKRLLRESTVDLLPQKVYQRYEKIGFATPINEVLDAKLKSQLKNKASWKLFNLKQKPSLWRQVAFQQWWDLFIKA